VGNFSFEQQLAERKRVNLPRHLLSLNADYATIWLSVAEPGDVIYAPHAVLGDLEIVATRLGLTQLGFITSLDQLKNPCDFQLVPWGWNQEMAELANSVLHQQSIPDLDIIQQANSRHMSFQLEKELHCALPEIIESTDIGEIQQHLQKLLLKYKQVVFKAEYGMSGRERILCLQPELTVQQFHWIRHRLEQGQRIYLEPWLDKVFEVSSHFLIDDQGQAKYLATTPLMTNQRGEHRGNIVGWDIMQSGLKQIAEIDSLVKKCAGILAKHGYRGPLSIDSMVFQTGNNLQIRPLQDINARWSMGRIAVEFQNRFSNDECALWHHYRQDHPVLELAVLDQELQSLHQQVMSKPATFTLKNRISTSPSSFAGDVVRFQTELISFM
jgi:hypothetical protein